MNTLFLLILSFMLEFFGIVLLAADSFGFKEKLENKLNKYVSGTKDWIQIGRATAALGVMTAGFVEPEGNIPKKIFGYFFGWILIYPFFATLDIFFDIYEKIEQFFKVAYIGALGILIGMLLQVLVFRIVLPN